MNDEQLRRVLAGGDIITDEQHDQARRCAACRTPYVVPDLARQCEARHDRATHHD